MKAYTKLIPTYHKNEANINVKSVVEKALAEAIEQAKRKRLSEAINALLLEMKEISEDEWVRAVRECRREH